MAAHMNWGLYIIDAELQKKKITVTEWQATKQKTVARH